MLANPRAPQKLLTQVLMRQGVLSEDLLKNLLHEKGRDGLWLEDLLNRSKILTPDQLEKMLERHYAVPYLALSKIKVGTEVLRILPWDFMCQHLLVPIDLNKSELMVVMANPSDREALAWILANTGYQVRTRVSTEKEILLFLDRHEELIQGKLKKETLIAAEDILKVQAGDHEPSPQDLADEKSPMVRFVHQILSHATRAGVSDVHVEPISEHEGVIRFRIDGMLRVVSKIPLRALLLLTSCVKVMSKMDITEKRLPQDGQFRSLVEGRAADCRASTLPGKYGEKVVIRLLNRQDTPLRLEDLGFEEQSLRILREWLDKPYGMILVTGPTGSGKTTTLYAAIQTIRSPDKNIITLENPIEIDFASASGNEGSVTQVQINEKVGLTFSVALRSTLRQDPDVILVGEIRDKETAEIAMSAANTGHLVLSTLHTNDSIETLSRLLDLDVEPFLIGTSLIGVACQRLLRRLCPDCRQSYRAPQKLKESLCAQTGIRAEDIEFFRAKGCEACGNTGYRGRIAVAEMFELDDESRELILNRRPSGDVRKHWRALGAKTLRENAMRAVAMGKTTMAEVLRLFS
ncbi:MAG: type II/IV secretion system protein [Elusimicrobia bacterium]|nr:type II/IV secretion system protein [Elusimicrobiota bacterium]